MQICRQFFEPLYVHRFALDVFACVLVYATQPTSLTMLWHQRRGSRGMPNGRADGGRGMTLSSCVDSMVEQRNIWKLHNAYIAPCSTYSLIVLIGFSLIFIDYIVAVSTIYYDIDGYHLHYATIVTGHTVLTLLQHTTVAQKTVPMFVYFVLNTPNTYNL